MKLCLAFSNFYLDVTDGTDILLMSRAPLVLPCYILHEIDEVLNILMIKR